MYLLRVVRSLGGVVYNLMQQEARIELLAKLQYFIAVFTGHCCKSSNARLFLF